MEQYRTLPVERLEYIVSCSSERGRIERAGATLLLERILKEMGERLEDVTVSERGKPLHDRLQFNLSHTERLAVLAISSKPVGCDAEKIRQVPSIVLSRFSESERIWAEENEGGFFRIWTCKESYLKYTGEGLSAYGCIGVDMNRHAIVRNGSDCLCHLREYALGGYAISVCADETEFAPMREIRLTE